MRRWRIVFARRKILWRAGRKNGENGCLSIKKYRNITYSVEKKQKKFNQPLVFSFFFVFLHSHF